METIVARDLFVKLTDPTGKHKPVINQHRVWDAERFIAAQVAQHDGEKTKPEDVRLVTVSSAEEYAAARREFNDSPEA